MGPRGSVVQFGFQDRRSWARGHGLATAAVFSLMAPWARLSSV